MVLKHSAQSGKMCMWQCPAECAVRHRGNMALGPVQLLSAGTLASSLTVQHQQQRRLVHIKLVSSGLQP